MGFGDTSLTKVFVGGLAWETPVDDFRTYFQKFGDILEAVIISDKLSGRSKGYGFVTFKEPEAAKKACEDRAPIINGRRANCNLAAQGPCRTKTSSGIVLNAGGKPRLGLPATVPPTRNDQWYSPTGVIPTTSPFHHYLFQAAPSYGCSPVHRGAYYPHRCMRGPAANTWMMPYSQQQMYYHPAMGFQAQMFPSGPTMANGPNSCPLNHQSIKF